MNDREDDAPPLFLPEWFNEPPTGWSDLVGEPEPRFRVYLEWRDIWVGAFIDPDAVYICPLPCVVLRFRRRPKACKPIPCPPFEDVTLIQE